MAGDAVAREVVVVVVEEEEEEEEEEKEEDAGHAHMLEELAETLR